MGPFRVMQPVQDREMPPYACLSQASAASQVSELGLTEWVTSCINKCCWLRGRGAVLA